MAKRSSGTNARAAMQEQTGRRKDMHIGNDATGFLVTSLSMGGSEVEPGNNAWEQAVSAGNIVPIELYQDDSFNVRVVVGDSLTAKENDEWVGKLSSKLNVSDGKLVVCGGIEFVMESLKWVTESYGEPDMIEVPAGTYRLDIYAYITSVNGTPLLAQAEKGKTEPVGAYFRRTRKSGMFPLWLQRWCAASGEADPGHETEWASLPYPVGKENFVDFLLHLIPLNADDKLDSKQLTDGFFNWGAFETRKPKKCPGGLLAENLVGLPCKTVEATKTYVDVFSRWPDQTLIKLDKPVLLPLEEVRVLFTVAWFANNAVDPEICIRASGDSQRIQFEVSNGRWAHFAQMKELAATLPSTVNDGAEIELACMARTDNENSQSNLADAGDVAPPGLMRFKGTASQGRWKIEEVFPAVSAELLEAALQLAREAEQGSHLHVPDETAANTALLFWQARWVSLYRDNMPRLSGGQFQLSKAEPDLTWLLAAEYFRASHFAKSFPVTQPDADTLAEVKKLQRWVNELVLDAGDRRYAVGDTSILWPAMLQKLNQVDESILELGGRIIGNLACSALRDVIFRYYLLPDCETRVLWKAGPYTQPTVEIFTEFVNGGLLSTFAQAGSASDQPEKKIYVSHYPNASLRELVEKHQARVKELLPKLFAALRAADTLEYCAKRFEAAMQRAAN